MELGDADFLDDGGGGGGCEVGAAAVSCSICLELVVDKGHRSLAKLQCGHEFHLDCIGSAFNSKGAMQCPNCRKIEKGQWLYSNGNRSMPEFSFEEWAHDEDLYDLSYSEMSIGLHWCPFTRVPSSFDEGEFPSGAYHDLLRPHAVFAEHTNMSPASHPCPYVTYFGPIHPSSSASSGSLSDGSTFNNHWNGPSGPSEVPNSYAFPTMDLHYHNLDRPSPFPTSTHDQHLIPSVTQRAGRNASEIARAGMHPFILGHSSASRAPLITSSVLPTYPGNVARPRNRSSSLQTYFQQSGNNPPVARAPPVISNGRRSSSSSTSSHRGLAQAAPIATLSSEQSTGFYLFSSNPSGRTFLEGENNHPEHLQRWEHEHHQPLFPSGQADQDSIWGPFHPPAAGSDGVFRSGNLRQRHGSERTPSQNRS